MSTLIKRKRFSNTFCTVAIVFAMLSFGQAQSAIFVEIPQIPGDTNDKDHRVAIDALSATGNFSGRGCGTFRVVKELDVATPLLIGSVVSKQRHPSVDFVYTSSSADSGRLEFFRMTLNNVRITKLASMSAEEANGRPTEEVSFKANSVEIAYTPVDQRGQPGTPVIESVNCVRTK